MSINGLLIGQTNDEYKQMQRNKNKEFLDKMLLPKAVQKPVNQTLVLPPINQNKVNLVPKFAR